MGATQPGHGLSSKTIIGTAVLMIGLVTILTASKRRPPEIDLSSSRLDEATHDCHGRSARIPEEIPIRGLKDVFWRVVSEITEDRATLIAGGVTFYILLALFPALAALVSLYGLILEPSDMARHLQDIALLLPPGAFNVISDHLTDLVARRTGELGTTFFIGLAIALWSSHSGTMALFDAMNIAYEEREKRSFIRLNMIALVFTLCGIVGAVLLIGLVAVLPAVLSYLWLDQWSETLALISRWPLLLIVIVICVSAIYRFGPSREPARVRWLTWGVVFSTAAWLGMSMGFSLYLTNFANYSVAYGALGTLIGFLVWTWLSVLILIAGAEINAELEHQTVQDTTTGQPLPLGERGAYVADTIGRPAQ
jgi:membrane protein